MAPMGPEWFVVIGVVVLLFGGSQLPKLARSLGEAQKEFKKGSEEPVDTTGTVADKSSDNQTAR